MDRISIGLEIFNEDKKETTYELRYNRETYLIFVVHDGEFHNSLYECEKEIPAELEWFLDTVIREDLKRWK